MLWPDGPAAPLLSLLGDAELFTFSETEVLLLYERFPKLNLKRVFEIKTLPYLGLARPNMMV